MRPSGRSRATGRKCLPYEALSIARPDRISWPPGFPPTHLALLYPGTTRPPGTEDYAEPAPAGLISRAPEGSRDSAHPDSLRVAHGRDRFLALFDYRTFSYASGSGRPAQLLGRVVRSGYPTQQVCGQVPCQVSRPPTAQPIDLSIILAVSAAATQKIAVASTVKVASCRCSRCRT